MEDTSPSPKGGLHSLDNTSLSGACPDAALPLPVLNTMRLNKVVTALGIELEVTAL